MKIKGWFGFGVSCFLTFNLTASLPATTTQTDNPEVPREFPKLDQNYTFVDNSSIRESLVNRAVTDTEVVDLLIDEDNLKENVTPEGATTPQPDEAVAPKSDVEWIEDGENTEDNKLELENNEQTKAPEKHSTESSTVKSVSAEEAHLDGVPLINGSVAAILIGVLLLVSVSGYIALILWRKSLELKYGSREVLVDKDVYDPDDMRHFSI